MLTIFVIGYLDLEYNAHYDGCCNGQRIKSVLLESDLITDLMMQQGPQFGANHGPYLHTCDVPDWGITVMAHSKSDDMHFRVLGGSFQASDLPVVLDMPWEGNITIPLTEDDEDNYVVGIGMDFTSSMVCFRIAITNVFPCKSHCQDIHSFV